MGTLPLKSLPTASKTLLKHRDVCSQLSASENADKSFAPSGDNESAFSTSTMTEGSQLNSVVSDHAMEVDCEGVDFNAPPGTYKTKDVRDTERSTDILKKMSDLSKAVRDGVGFRTLSRNYKEDIFRHLSFERRLNFTLTKEGMYKQLLAWVRTFSSVVVFVLN